MKKVLYTVIIIPLLVLTFISCSKDDDLNVDLSGYNYDSFEKLPIDDYIFNNLTKPYNVEVVYRFDRSHTDVAKDISPPRIDQVQPAVDMVLDGFFRVYQNVAGAEFIKRYAPKQFVLLGSHAYNSNGSVTLGTADGGRRVALYDINNIDVTKPEDIKRRLRTIHHEFTHIINQLVDIPPTFRTVTTDYIADWTKDNSDADALELGFVSPYSRSSFGEDFAETVAHLLVEGQAFYDNRIANSSDDGAAKLRQKEVIVHDYFKQFFNIDFKELQYEMYLMLSTVYKDKSQTLHGLLEKGSVENIAVDFINGTHYSLYGKSDKFDEVWEETKVGLAAYGNNGGRYPTEFKLVFTSAKKMQLQVTYKNLSNSTLSAYYDYDVKIENDEISFTSIDDGSTETAYGNGRIIKNAIKPLLDYFVKNQFSADWISTEIVGYANSLKYGQLKVVGDKTNYIYGPVVLK